MNLSSKKCLSLLLASAVFSFLPVRQALGTDLIETESYQRYGHTLIKSNSLIFTGSLPQEDRTKILKEFVENLSTNKPDKAIYVEIPMNEMNLCSLLHEAGFSYESTYFHEESGERKVKGQRWFIPNQSLVPPQPSFTHTARMMPIALREGSPYVLRVDMRGTMIFPGGSQNPNETAMDAACRELKEETNIDLEGWLIAPVGKIERVSHSDNLGQKSATDVTEYFFAYYDFKDAPVPKFILSHENNKGYWDLAVDVLKEPNFSPHNKKLLETILYGTVAHRENLPDFHTYYKGSSRQEASKIWPQEMTVTYYNQNSLFAN